MEKWGNEMEIRLQQWLNACQPHHVRMLSRESRVEPIQGGIFRIITYTHIHQR